MNTQTSLNEAVKLKAKTEAEILENFTERLSAAVDKWRGSKETFIEDCVNIGRILRDAKLKFGYRKYGEWLESRDFGVAKTQRTIYVNAADSVDALKENGWTEEEIHESTTSIEALAKLEKRAHLEDPWEKPEPKPRKPKQDLVDAAHFSDLENEIVSLKSQLENLNANFDDAVNEEVKNRLSTFDTQFIPMKSFDKAVEAEVLKHMQGVAKIIAEAPDVGAELDALRRKVKDLEAAPVAARIASDAIEMPKGLDMAQFNPQLPKEARQSNGDYLDVREIKFCGQTVFPKMGNTLSYTDTLVWCHAIKDQIGRMHSHPHYKNVENLGLNIAQTGANIICRANPAVGNLWAEIGVGIQARGKDTPVGDWFDMAVLPNQITGKPHNRDEKNLPVETGAATPAKKRAPAKKKAAAKKTKE